MFFFYQQNIIIKQTTVLFVIQLHKNKIKNIIKLVKLNDFSAYKLHNAVQ